MNAEKRLAMDLLDAVWKEDVQGVENCLELGASQVGYLMDILS